MNYLELFASLLGIVSVWYARKENILVFPIGIVSVLIYVYICIAAQLYANAAINGVYFLSNAYGWYMWSRKNENNESIQITDSTIKQKIFIWTSIVLIYTISLFVLRITNANDTEYLGSYLSYIDAFNTAFFLVATILMIFKKVDNWLFWIIGNVVSIPIYLSQGLYFTAVQYSIFLVLAVLGYREWKRKMAI